MVRNVEQVRIRKEAVVAYSNNMTTFTYRPRKQTVCQDGRTLGPLRLHVPTTPLHHPAPSNIRIADLNPDRFVNVLGAFDF